MPIRREIQDLQDGPAGMTVEADSKRQIVETAKVRELRLKRLFFRSISTLAFSFGTFDPFR